MPTSRWIRYSLWPAPRLLLLRCGEAERDSAIAGTEDQGGLRSAGRGASIRRGEGSQLAWRWQQSREQPWPAESSTDAAQPATWDGTTPSRRFVSTASRGICSSLRARLGLRRDSFVRKEWPSGGTTATTPARAIRTYVQRAPTEPPTGFIARAAESKRVEGVTGGSSHDPRSQRWLAPYPEVRFSQRVLPMLWCLDAGVSRPQGHRQSLYTCGRRAQADDGWNSEEDVRSPKPKPHSPKSERGAAAKGQQATTDSAVEAVTAQLAATSMRTSASAAAPRTHAATSVSAAPPAAVASVAAVAATPAADAAAFEPKAEPYVPQDPKLELERKARSLRKKVCNDFPQNSPPTSFDLSFHRRSTGTRFRSKHPDPTATNSRGSLLTALLDNDTRVGWLHDARA
jgi:hypothetical protein